MFGQEGSSRAGRLFLAASFSCIIAGKQWESSVWERGGGRGIGGGEEEEKEAVLIFKSKLWRETCNFLLLVTSLSDPGFGTKTGLRRDSFLSTCCGRVKL